MRVVAAWPTLITRNQQDVRHYLFILINILYVVKAVVSFVIAYYFAAKLTNTEIIPLNLVKTRRVSFDWILGKKMGGLIMLDGQERTPE